MRIFTPALLRGAGMLLGLTPCSTTREGTAGNCYRQMKAVRVNQFGDEDVLRVESTRVPKLKSDEVLIKVRAAGVNPVECYIRSGNFKFPKDLNTPFTPGFDAAGTVEDTGAHVYKFVKGDRVFTGRGAGTGTYAQFAIAKEKDIGFLAPKLTYPQGACLGIPYFTAFKALKKIAEAKPGETVLIHGASGGVGVACVEFAKAMGLRVLATVGSEDGAALACSRGAEKVFFHNVEGYDEEIKKYLWCTGPDIIVDMLANQNLQRDLDLLNDKGRVVIVGSRGLTDMESLCLIERELSVLGCAILVSSEAEWREFLCAVQAGQRGGYLNPHVSEHFTLYEAPLAHYCVLSNKKKVGQYVLDLEDDPCPQEEPVVNEC